MYGIYHLHNVLKQSAKGALLQKFESQGTTTSIFSTNLSKFCRFVPAALKHFSRSVIFNIKCAN